MSRILNKINCIVEGHSGGEFFLEVIAVKNNILFCLYACMNA